ncbi:MAG: hypothetical protein ACOCUO_00720 [archaeon]
MLEARPVPFEPGAVHDYTNRLGVGRFWEQCVFDGLVAVREMVFHLK